MALLWIDGFEGYGVSSNPSALTVRYAATTSAGSNFTIAAGRTSGYSISCGGSQPAFITPPLADPCDPTLIIGFAGKFTTNSGGSESSIVVNLYDNPTLGIVVQFISYTPNSSIIVKLGATTLFTYTNFLILLNVWYYFEIKVFTHPTAGTVEVRVNGVTLVSLSGINTQPGFHNYHNTVGVYIYRIGGFDDYYICDSTGLLMNDFQGACRVIGLLPNADTGTEQWTPSTGTAHYACVDENPPNAASDYVSSSTQAQIGIKIM